MGKFLINGELVRSVSPIICDKCNFPQSPRRRTCETCGTMYSESKFDINEPPDLASWDNDGGNTGDML